jgi:hypothetical protein
MELICSNCEVTIPAQNINIATNMAKCSRCNSLLLVSDLKEKRSLAELLVLPSNPTVQIKQGQNGEIELIAPANFFVIAEGGSRLIAGIIVFVFAGIMLNGFLEPTLSSIFSIFSLFVLIFIIPGIFFLITAFDLFFYSQRVVLTNNEVTLVVRKFLRSDVTVLSKDKITDVVLTNLAQIGSWKVFFGIGVNRRQRKYVNYPAIVTKNNTYFFFQDLPVPEQDWAFKLLKGVLLDSRS